MNAKANTPKLDVQTLEYVIAMVEENRQNYRRKIAEFDEQGNEYKADAAAFSMCAMTALKRDLRELIQEAE